ncbi:MAG: hypothetical protein M0P64_04405 [Candidatus Pacebacteria bacterium]|jgi:hypothetical protein|nr:hypothetical protein [Candidatus Paceibacterota bacterium]
MSILIKCPHCGVVVGEITTFGDFVGQSRRLLDLVVSELQSSVLDCSKHNVVTTKTKHLFGLLEQTLVEYPETDTSSLSFEYLGPANKFWLWFALLFTGSDGITVNGKLAWWDFKTGFFGDGVDELANFKSKSA